MSVSMVCMLIVLGVLIFTGLTYPQMTHLGGEYYRDSSHVYVKVKGGGGGFIDLTPDSYTFEEVIGSDPETFVVLADGYAKDRNYVYNGQRLDDVDVRTFEPIGKGFYRDKQNVRYGSTLQLKRLQPQSKPASFDAYSFESLGCGFVRDDTGVYASRSHGDDLSEHNRYHKYDLRVDVLDRIDIIDAATFEVLKEGDLSGCEAKDRFFLYHTTGMMSDPGRVDIVRAHGAEQYEALGCDFIRTGRGIFWVDQRLDGADQNTFEALIKKSGKECGYGFYAKDKNHVYYQNRLVEGADPQTFKVLDTVWSYHYAFDKNNRYIQGNNIKKLNDPDYEMKNFEKAYQEWMQSRRGGR